MIHASHKMASLALFIGVYYLLVKLSEVDAAGLSVSPRDTIAIVDANATLECSAGSGRFVNWWFRRAGETRDLEFYLAKTMYKPFEGRYRVDTSKPDHYDLVIDKVQKTHAGRYKCCLDDGCEYGEAVAELIAINPTSFKPTNGLIPFNCHIFGERTVVDKLFMVDQFVTPVMKELMKLNSLDTTVACTNTSIDNDEFDCTIGVACPQNNLGCQTSVASTPDGFRLGWIYLLVIPVVVGILIIVLLILCIRIFTNKRRSFSNVDARKKSPDLVCNATYAEVPEILYSTDVVSWSDVEGKLNQENHGDLKLNLLNISTNITTLESDKELLEKVK